MADNTNDSVALVTRRRQYARRTVTPQRLLRTESTLRQKHTTRKRTHPVINDTEDDDEVRRGPAAPWLDLPLEMWTAIVRLLGKSSRVALAACCSVLAEIVQSGYDPIHTIVVRAPLPRLSANIAFPRVERVHCNFSLNGPYIVKYLCNLFARMAQTDSTILAFAYDGPDSSATPYYHHRISLRGDSVTSSAPPQQAMRIRVAQMSTFSRIDAFWAMKKWIDLDYLQVLVIHGANANFDDIDLRLPNLKRLELCECTIDTLMQLKQTNINVPTTCELSLRSLLPSPINRPFDFQVPPLFWSVHPRGDAYTLFSRITIHDIDSLCLLASTFNPLRLTLAGLRRISHLPPIHITFNNFTLPARYARAPSFTCVDALYEKILSRNLHFPKIPVYTQNTPMQSQLNLLVAYTSVFSVFEFKSPE